MEEIQEAAKLSNAHNFISEFPDGYSTFVGEKGNIKNRHNCFQELNFLVDRNSELRLQELSLRTQSCSY